MDIAMLAETYGPYAFGLVSFVVLWLVAVKPTLRANKVDSAELQAVTNTLKEVSIVNSQTAIVLERTAAALDRTAVALQTNALRSGDR